MNDVGRRTDSGGSHWIARAGIVIETFTGRTEEFHGREVPLDSAVRLWWFEPTHDALVLGSTQHESVVDVAACQARGVDIVRRRSGGGLVLLTAAGTLWLDVVLPVEHPLWDRDVTTSSFWLGEVWIAALAAVGVSPVVQHRSGLIRSPLSDLICFAGRGPGEVFDVSGSKVVGISQRRTRHHARFQCALSLEWEPQRLFELLAPECRKQGLSSAADIERAGSSLDVDRQRLVEVMTDLLVRRLSEN